ncbi:flagellar filament capping protein FliD [Pseudomonas paeninsulae]|uniref:flagellar filament capping protein FliD n=1 Tax=Pseudomonas paeninsulae TaxID=3110772 RepID=UPI002D77751A|nr:flagellar filament capping protein FliD [Pseudomonas sp. IT1137]
MVGITGIGSGIDIDSMVGALVGAEKAPKEAQLSRLEKATTSKISALGQLNSALNSFQTALKKLNDISLFEKRSASSSNSSLVTATASKTAQAGNYSLKVEALASGSKAASRSLAGDFSTGAAGTLTVKLGADDPGISVDIAEGLSLGQVRDALNSQLKDSGISANLVTNPEDGKTRLIMTSSNTGAGKDVQIEAGAGLEALAIGGGLLNQDDPGYASQSGVLEASSNAKFSIDGLALQSASNTVDGAIPEVTFNLLAADKDKTVTVKVAQDQSGVTTNIKKFVEAYNSLMSTTQSLTSVTSVGEGKEPVTGSLLGDSSVRGLLSTIRNQLASPAAQEGVRVLSELGITTQKDGTLAIDDAKLSSALESNFDAVGAFFTGDSGLMNRLSSQVDGYVKSDGILNQRISGLQKTINSVDEQREALNLRIDKLQARLYSQFNAMDSLVAQLTQTSDWLTSSLDSLPGFVNKNK